MTVDVEHYISGAFIRSDGTARISVLNPATEVPIAAIPYGSSTHVERAVEAARAALPEWSSAGPEARGAALRLLAEALREQAAGLAALLTTDVGTPVTLSRALQVDGALAHLDDFADLAAKLVVRERSVGGALIAQRPVGVVGCVTPWNYPLHQVLVKVGAALAAGCTVVVKPSELAPMAIDALAQAAQSASLPAGVFNVVYGSGPVTGAALVEHPDVDLVSFTGSTAVGRAIAATAGGRLARVVLELGGKSANILLADADLDTAVPDAIMRCFVNSGQTCSALSRLIVPRGLLSRVEEIAAGVAAGLATGDPRDPSVLLGPLISAAQRERVNGHVARGVADGGRLISGNRSTHPEFGFFVEPAIISDVDPSSALGQEEVFGPVIALMAHDGDKHAVAIANSSRYRLFGAVSSADRERALAVAGQLRTGAVIVNSAPFDPTAPFGGTGQSGIGREHGAAGLAEFLEPMAVHVG